MVPITAQFLTNLGKDGCGAIEFVDQVLNDNYYKTVTRANYNFSTGHSYVEIDDVALNSINRKVLYYPQQANTKESV